MTKISVAAAARDALKQDKKLRNAFTDGSGAFPVSTHDSFVNFSQKLGIGADNPLSSGTYGFNPITRNRTLLEWIHRGSWLGGQAIDIVADDMTRAGVEFVNEMDPQDAEEIEKTATEMKLWENAAEVVQWGRLYGGAIAIALIDGQNFSTPLRLETVGQDQFKGIMVLDRWQVEPSVNNLVTDLGPHLGLPKFYRVTANAPALRGMNIHYSRVLIRHTGVNIPYQQRLTENLWGLSVLERLYDRMIAFDSASTGAAQLVYKSYLRTLSVDALREIVAQGGQALDGLTKYVDMMRRFQSIEGITLIDMKDKLEVQGHQAFSGMADILTQFGQQLAGALQIPLVRLFGQSPAGLNSTGESDVRTYYDGIKQKQTRDLHSGVTTCYRLMAQSKGIKLPKNFAVNFRSLWQLNDAEKSEAAGKLTSAVNEAYGSSIIGRQTALKELRQASRVTGVFSNITSEMIEAADDDVGPPPGALEEAGMNLQGEQFEHSKSISEQEQARADEALKMKNKEGTPASGGKNEKTNDGRRRVRVIFEG